MLAQAALRPGEWYEVIAAAFQQVVGTLVSYLPNLVGAVAILIVGWVISKLLQRVAHRIMRLARLDALLAKSDLEDALHKAGVETTTAEVIGKLVYWIVFVVFLIAAANTLGLQVVSRALTDLVGYIPNVIAAVLILVFGAYIARLVRDAVTAGMLKANLAFGQTVGIVAQVALIVFVVLVALGQLGINVAILMSNATILVAGVMLALALAFGLGMRDIVGNLVAAYYVGQLVKVGDTLQVAGHIGQVSALRHTSVVLKTTDGYALVPNKEVLTTATVSSRGGPDPGSEEASQK